ncbi:uncharacterized protein LOC142229295 [Haematobia irritans]|uniref:uncharacterized protein LOC142229295 n=1 Tax=Haematobia irritans TaxID=7368 RepID=UPI003F503737
MKQIIFFILLVINIYPVILAKCRLYPTSYNVCKYKDGTIFKKGEIYRPQGECQQITCFGNGNMGGVNCPSVIPPPPPAVCQYVPEDISKTYPECCEHYICDTM